MKNWYIVKIDKINKETEQQEKMFGASNIILNEHFLIKNVNNTLSTWVPSINDCLAEDWYVIED